MKMLQSADGYYFYFLDVIALSGTIIILISAKSYIKSKGNNDARYTYIK